MIVRELTKNELSQCKQLKDENFYKQLNLRRNFLQTLVVNELVIHRKLIVNAFTSFGKSFCTKQGILRMNKKYGEQEKHIVVVPTINLKRDFEKTLEGIPNVSVFVINTFVKGSYENVRSVWFDEVHTCLNPHSLEFSKAFTIVDCPLKIGMSATLNNEQIEFAEQLGFKARFSIPLHIGLQLELIPTYKIYNLAVEFTENEKTQYVKIDDAYKDYVRYFEPVAPKSTAYFIPMLLQGKKQVKWNNEYTTGNELVKKASEELGISEKQCILTALKWMKQVSARKNLLYKAKNKFVVLEEVLDLVEDKNTIVFFFTQKQANEVAKKSKLRAAFHGGNSKPQTMEDFKKGILKVLCTSKMLQAGQVSDNSSIAIQTFFTTQSRALQQILGRQLRFDEENPDKIGLLINFYINDFEYKGKKYFSQDLVWLHKALVGSKFIFWIDEIEQITELFEDEY